MNIFFFCKTFFNLWQNYLCKVGGWLLWPICDTVQLMPIRFDLCHGRMPSMLATVYGKFVCLWDSEVLCTTLRPTSWNNSLLVGNYVAVSAWKLVLLPPPYKYYPFILSFPGLWHSCWRSGQSPERRSETAGGHCQGPAKKPQITSLRRSYICAGYCQWKGNNSLLTVGECHFQFSFTTTCPH